MTKQKQSRSVIYLCGLSFILCLILGALVFRTGQHVHDLKSDINIKNQQLLKEQERLRVLRAEWSHLNSPERLDKLMQRKQELNNPQAEYERFERPALHGTRINDVDDGGALE